MRPILIVSMLSLGLAFASTALAQAPGDFPPGPPPGFDGPPPGGPDGPGRGPGFFRGPGGPKTKLVEKFDKDGDKVLNAAERKAALEYLENERKEGRGGRRGPRREEGEAAKPGPKVTPAAVRNFGATPLYDSAALRTIFIQFEQPDWEKEMAAFKNTDVEIPAKVIVDGKTYSNVGVHFRGASSFMMVAEGRKRSLNLTFDMVDKDQHLLGYRSLELLNSHEDPTFLRSVLSYQIEREFIPAPKANFMRVVINGESWGIYVNAQPFNKDFIKEAYGTTKGARWKTPGSPGGRASLRYLGDDVEKYKGIYEIKSKDDPKGWTDLIRLCKTLTETPADKLEAALTPILDVDGALKFLALENALVNNDGYWIRTSDYSIYEDIKGVFHIIPHDSNETFSRPESPRGPGGPRGGGFGGPRPRFNENGNGNGNPNGDRPPRPQVKGVELDPLVAANDDNKLLISKLLAVPAWRTKYLGYVREVAEKWLDWKTLGPIATRYQSVIAEDIKIDTRKLDSTEDFTKGVTDDTEGRGGFGPGSQGAIGLKKFADQRREYLLKVTQNPN